jgi:hypothetical protein
LPTVIGTDSVSSISERLVMPVITDQVYGGNALFWRWNRANKHSYDGGRHIEAIFITSKFSNGGPYQGFEELDVSPNETEKNGGWDWKYHYVPVSLDAGTLIKMNTTRAAANIITLRWEQARMHMADKLGTGLWSDIVTNSKEIDGLKGTIDDGTVATSYAGLTRSTNTYLNSQVDATSATLTWTLLQNMVTNSTQGAHHPTIIMSRKEQYSRFLGLGVGNQRHPVGPSGHDEQLLSMGFTNALFETIPWVVDDKVPDGPNSSNSRIYFIDEDPFELAIAGGRDFKMRPFQTPTRQDAMVGFLFWAGNVICRRPQTSGVLTNVSA